MNNRYSLSEAATQKKTKTLVFKTANCLMQIKSITEFSRDLVVNITKKNLPITVLPAKDDNGVKFCIQSY